MAVSKIVSIFAPVKRSGMTKMKEDLLSGESRQDMESLSSRPLPRLGDSPFLYIQLCSTSILP
nr:MAG TPA: hypothetical protein [Caudoviricetes sp.]